jgi:DNA-binding MarR family transcriptional regulator
VTRLTDAQWRLSRSVLRQLDREPGLTGNQLAKRLNTSYADLRPVLGMLIGRGVVERCGDYLVAAVKPDAGGSS